jgi:hypothetical protein
MSYAPGANPFPGLRPFETSEHNLFFGREGQSEELLNQLLKVRMLAVVGTSGSGKSSLVRAGLVPYLQALPGAHWRVAVFRPSGNPIGSLATALNSPDVVGKAADSDEDAARDRSLLEARLRRSGLGLIEVVRLARLAEEQKILIVIDQFEELFRFIGSAEHRDDGAAFVKLILEAVHQTELPIFIALTMRSDFIGDCSQFHELPETVAAGLYLIPRMTREQRRAAIEEPVRIAGGGIARRLTNRVLNDAGDDPDQLPIMQHALRRFWENWIAPGPPLEHPMDLENYLAIGGMAEALSRHADEAFNELDDNGKIIARRMFQCLTEKEADNRKIRRATEVATLASVVGVTVPELKNVIEVFREPGRSFLMPSPPVPLADDTRIDISHESLIRRWNRLAGWVEEEAESATIYRRLEQTAMLHEQHRAGLWGDPDLSESLAWRERIRPTEPWAERYGGHFKIASDFLEESRRARDAALRRKRQLWGAVIGATILVIVGLSITTIVALNEKDRAQLAEERAHEATVDVAQVANLARGRVSEYVDSWLNSVGDTLSWAPPAWYAYLHRRKAAALEASGNFSAAQTEVDLARKAAPDYLPLLITASDLSVISGNAEAAVRDSATYLQTSKTDTIAYGNPVIAEGMLHHYGEASRLIDEALQNARLPISDIESLIAPDVQDLTHGFELSVQDTDFLLALRYTKAFLYAMSGDDRFRTALDEADRSDRDYPYSRNAYLEALNWAWLIVRGQGLQDVKAAEAGNGAPAPVRKLTDYGAFAVEGALWERVARSRPEYHDRARSAFEKFQAAYRNDPQARYGALAAWVDQQLGQPFQAVPPESDTVDRASALAQHAQELKAAAGSHPLDFAPAFAELSQAVDLLTAKPGSSMGRRQQDLLIDLLLRRAGWRLEGSTDEQDKGGAAEDAHAVIALDPNVPEAYRILAAAAFDDATRRTNDEQALKLDPYNSAALSDLAKLIQNTDPKGAIALLQKRQRVATTWSNDYQLLAQLQTQVGNYAEALHDIDNAIADAPWQLDFYTQRRDIEKKMGTVDPATVNLHFAEGLRAAGAYHAQTGDDGLAVKRYLLAFMTLSSATTLSADAKVELDTTVRSLTTFLSANYGAVDAKLFWQTLSHDPLLNSTQQQLAADAAKRLSD